LEEFPPEAIVRYAFFCRVDIAGAACAPEFLNLKIRMKLFLVIRLLPVFRAKRSSIEAIFTPKTRLPMSSKQARNMAPV
jgi:hypothetical protein